MILAALMMIAPLQALGGSNYQVDTVIHAPTSKPTWYDNFEGKTLDQSKWRFDVTMNKTGWPNHELEYYTENRPENARVEDGSLVIQARREKLSARSDWSGQDYTSAKLVSRSPFSFGFYEVRAKLPCGIGTWPAIWLLPDSGTWPDEGEIDVMEMVGWQPHVVHATLHTAAFNHRKGTQRGAEIAVPSSCDVYHRYQLDWRPDSITIGVDGRGYMRVDNDQPGGKAAWPFTRPYNLILNLAIGGDWGGAKGVDDAALPQQMRVDYVRYWKLNRPAAR